MSEQPPQRTKVFLISPIGEDKSPEREQADTVRRYLVEKALDSSRYKVDRADDDTNPGNITPRIIAAIQEAELVVADLTGLNPNVFYELAVAHGYQKPVVLIFKKGERIPFDLKDVRVVHYDITHPAALEQAQGQLRALAEAALKAPQDIQTPLSAAGRFIAVEQSGDPQVEVNAEVAEQLGAIRQHLKRLNVRAEDDEGFRFGPDTASLFHFIEGLVTVEQLEFDDLERLITDQTSPWFDGWVRSLQEKLRKPQADAPWNNSNDPWAGASAASAAANDPWAPASSDEPPF